MTSAAFYSFFKFPATKVWERLYLRRIAPSPPRRVEWINCWYHVQVYTRSIEEGVQWWVKSEFDHFFFFFFTRISHTCTANTDGLPRDICAACTPKTLGGGHYCYGATFPQSWFDHFRRTNWAFPFLLLFVFIECVIAWHILLAEKNKQNNFNSFLLIGRNIGDFRPCDGAVNTVFLASCLVFVTPLRLQLSSLAVRQTLFACRVKRVVVSPLSSRYVHACWRVT